MPSSALATAGRVTAVTMDQFDITGFYNEYKFKRDAALIDVTPFGNRVSVDLAGIQKASIELKGFYNSDHDTEMHKRFGQDDDVYLTLAPKGYRPMAPCIMLPSVITKYEISAKAKDSVDLDAEFALRGFVDDGVMLISPKTNITAATGVSGVYNAGELIGTTDGGCAAQLHVWSLTGTTPTLDVKIQHSDDGATGWGDLMTFDTVDLASVQRQDLDVGNSVKQYVRLSYALAGSGAARFLGGFARSIDFDS